MSKNNFYHYPHYRWNAGQTLNWLPQDTEELYQYNLKHRYQDLVDQGWVNRTIEYKFNSEGFRSDEFNVDSPSVLTLGCSLTTGIGLPIEETWSYQLAKSLGLSMYNLGIGGTSSDVAFRLGLYYIPKLKPQIVVFVPPDPYRFEVLVPSENYTHTICETYGPWTPSSANTEHVEFYKKWIANDSNAYLNRTKNILAIKHICKENNIKFVTASRHHLISSDRPDLARDLSHPGFYKNKEFASIVLNKINAN